MRKTWLGVGLLLLAGLFIVIATQTSAQVAHASDLAQSEIEARAIDYAQHLGGLRSAPKSVASKEMTFSEFNARLDPLSHDQVDPNSLRWLVAIQGDVVVVDDLPLMDGTRSAHAYDNVWVRLSPAGDVSAWGAQGPGSEVDLNATPEPFTPYPTPVNQQK